MTKNPLILSLLGFFLISEVGFGAFDLRALNWEMLKQNFLKDNSSFHWEPHFRSEWDWWPCDGVYDYNFVIEGTLQDVRFDPGQTEVLVQFYFGRVDTGLSGDYRSAWSACLTIPTHLWMGLENPYVKMKLRMESDQSIREADIEIMSTRVKALDLGGPDWLERGLTGLTNRALESLWRSWLGKKISSAISEEVQKKFPQSG